MATITNLGIGSGLPLNTLVEAFLEAESVPAQIRLQEQEDSLNLELSGVGAFKSALSSFQTTLDSLSSSDAFSQQTVSTSNDNISVTTNGFASNGSFDVEVQQLAEGSRQQTQAFTDSTDIVGSGVLTFAAGSETFDLTIEASDDLSAIRDKINEASGNFGVVANILNTDAGTFLQLDSTITGAANNLTVSTSDTSLDSISTNNVTQQNATDAIITVDGNTITQDSNEFKNIIEDVTITALKQTSTSVDNEASVLNISQDTSNGQGLIDDFISSFNSLRDQLTGLGAAQQGRLAFDPNVRQVKQQITDVIFNSVSGVGDVDSLQKLGIEIDKDGYLEISTFTSENILSGQERLDNALNNNAVQVGELFASDEGIVAQLSSIVGNYIETDGVLTQRELSLTEQLEEVDEDFIRLEERLLEYEDTLIKQFTALDSAVAGFNSTSDFVTSALGNLSNNDS